MNKQAKLLVREVASLIVIKEAIARKIIKILQEFKDSARVREGIARERFTGIGFHDCKNKKVGSRNFVEPFFIRNL